MSRKRKTAKKHTIGLIGSIIAVLFFLILVSRPWTKDPVPPQEAWQKADELGLANDIDPLLIFAIACAESSLDGHASNTKARGLMQMTPSAWEMVTNSPFRDAWVWQRNMEVAVSYLVLIKERQIKAKNYSWPTLVAAYRFGPNAVHRANYNIRRLPKARNEIYKELLAGRSPKLPLPAPERPIENGYPKPPVEENEASPPALTGKSDMLQ